ncbi:MAG: DUF305 domain-containing protein [Acidimicrobiales bacterium]
MITRFAPLAAFAAGALLLAACGGSDSAAPTNSTVPAATEDGSGAVGVAEFNDADVVFAQGMIPHHAQAIEMAALAADRSQNPAILDLAQRIRGAQDPEIELMRSWLDAWGHDEMAAEMEGMDHDMAGMMSDDHMAALTAATGPAFDRMFTEMMIVHHQGAIDQAQTVLDDGADAEARALAEAIIAAQSAEIDEMQNLDLG